MDVIRTIISNSICVILSMSTLSIAYAYINGIKINSCLTTIAYIIGAIMFIVLSFFATKLFRDYINIKKLFNEVVQINAQNILHLEKLKIPFDSSLYHLQKNVYQNFEKLKYFEINIRNANRIQFSLKTIKNLELYNKKLLNEKSKNIFSNLDIKVENDIDYTDMKMSAFEYNRSMQS